MWKRCCVKSERKKRKALEKLEFACLNGSLSVPIVTRWFCLVESHIVKTLLRVGVFCFTSFTFCNNNGSCSLRSNERIYICIHSSVFYLIELAVMINLHKWWHQSDFWKTPPFIFEILLFCVRINLFWTGLIKRQLKSYFVTLPNVSKLVLVDYIHFFSCTII